MRLNPIAAKSPSKPQLNSRLTAMLPKGMTLNQASRGFKNQGQFIAALHVSQNLGCDCFKQLRFDMTQKHMSLGQSIQDVKKTANAPVEVHRAETEANDELENQGQFIAALHVSRISAATASGRSGPTWSERT